MEIDNRTFNIYCLSNINKFEDDLINTVIEEYDISNINKKQLKIYVNVIKKYDVDKIDMYKFSKNRELPFLLLCIICDIKNVNKEKTNIYETNRIERYYEQVLNNKLSENDFKGICDNFMIDRKITDFFEKVCYCCSYYEYINGSLCVRPNA